MKGALSRNINSVKKVETLGEKALYFPMEYHYESRLGRYKVLCCFCNTDRFPPEPIIISSFLFNLHVCLRGGGECTYTVKRDSVMLIFINHNQNLQLPFYLTSLI